MRVPVLRIRAELNGWSGGPGLSTFYFDSGVAAVDGALVTGVTGRVRAYFAAWLAFMPTGNTALVNPVCDIVDVSTGALQGQVSAGAAPSVVVGTGGIQGPAFVCAVGRLSTSTFIGGKRLRGRTYAGPLAAAFTDSLAPEGGLQAAVQNGLVALNTAAGGPALVVWSRPRKAPQAPRAGAMAGVVNTSVSTTYGVLKSRR
jgi:hypothetical protein